jgi:hypothetical protein
MPYGNSAAGMTDQPTGRPGSVADQLRTSGS